MTASIVVSSVLFASDQLFWMKQLLVRSGSNLVCVKRERERGRREGERERERERGRERERERERERVLI